MLIICLSIITTANLNIFFSSLYYVKSTYIQTKNSKKKKKSKSPAGFEPKTLHAYSLIQEKTSEICDTLQFER